MNTSNDIEGDGMLKWENETADYMRRTGDHVIERLGAETSPLQGRGRAPFYLLRSEQ